MTYTPTLEEFLSEPSTDDLDDMVMDEPLVSIADSLRRLVALSGQHAVDARPGTSYTVTQEEYDELARAFDDSEAKQQALTGLVDEILAVCKPSVSKLANQVRETVEAWRNPEVPADPAEEPTDAAGYSNGPVSDGGMDPRAEQPVEDTSPCPVHASTDEPWSGCPTGPDCLVGHPDHDAPVEEWREVRRNVVTGWKHVCAEHEVGDLS